MDEYPHADLCPKNHEKGPCDCHVAKIAELEKHNNDLGAKLDDKKQIVQLKGWLDEALNIGRVNGRKVAELEATLDVRHKHINKLETKIAELEAELRC